MFGGFLVFHLEIFTGKEKNGNQRRLLKFGPNRNKKICPTTGEENGISFVCSTNLGWLPLLPSWELWFLNSSGLAARPAKPELYPIGEFCISSRKEAWVSLVVCQLNWVQMDLCQYIRLWQRDRIWCATLWPILPPVPIGPSSTHPIPHTPSALWLLGEIFIFSSTY